MKAVLSRAWYYIEPWVIWPPQRPMPWQGLVIILALILGLSVLGTLVATILR